MYSSNTRNSLFGNLSRKEQRSFYQSTAVPADTTMQTWSQESTYLTTDSSGDADCSNKAIILQVFI